MADWGIVQGRKGAQGGWRRSVSSDLQAGQGGRCDSCQGDSRITVGLIVCGVAGVIEEGTPISDMQLTE